MTAIQQADVISSLLILDAVSGAVFYGLVFTGLCLVVKQIVR